MGARSIQTRTTRTDPGGLPLTHPVCRYHGPLLDIFSGFCMFDTFCGPHCLHSDLRSVGLCVIAFVPTRILSDCGQEFVRYVWEQLPKWMGCTVFHTSPYHPQENAKVERSHRTINNLIKASLADVGFNLWPDLVSSVQLTLNTSSRDGHH